MYCEYTNLLDMTDALYLIFQRLSSAPFMSRICLIYLSQLYSVFLILSIDNAISRVSIVLCVGEVPLCLSNGSTIDHYVPLFAPYLADVTRRSSAVTPCIQLCDVAASNSVCHFVRERNVTSFTDQAASGCGSLDCRPSILRKSNSSYFFCCTY